MTRNTDFFHQRWGAVVLFQRCGQQSLGRFLPWILAGVLFLTPTLVQGQETLSRQIADLYENDINFVVVPHYPAVTQMIALPTLGSVELLIYPTQTLAELIDKSLFLKAIELRSLGATGGIDLLVHATGTPPAGTASGSGRLGGFNSLSLPSSIGGGAGGSSGGSSTFRALNSTPGTTSNVVNTNPGGGNSVQVGTVDNPDLTEPSPVQQPEPASAALLIIGIVGLWVVRRKTSRAAISADATGGT